MVVGIPLSQRLLRKQFLALTVGKFEINRLNQSSYQYHSQNQLKTSRCLIIVQIMKRGRVILERGLKSQEIGDDTDVISLNSQLHC